MNDIDDIDLIKACKEHEILREHFVEVAVNYIQKYCDDRSIKHFVHFLIKNLNDEICKNKGNFERMKYLTSKVRNQKRQLRKFNKLWNAVKMGQKGGRMDG